MPTCRKCGDPKDADDFGWIDVLHTKRRKTCRDCINSAARQSATLRKLDPDCCTRERLRHQEYCKRPGVRERRTRQARIRRKRPAVRKKHTESQRLPNALRRAKLRGLDATLTIAQWDEIQERFSFQCAYCGRRKKLTKDRINSRCGYTAENVVPACQSCNSRKRDGEVLCPLQMPILFSAITDGDVRPATMFSLRKPLTRLNASKAREAVSLYRAGISAAQIAREQCVKRGTIRDLLQGKTWGWATGLIGTAIEVLRNDHIHNRNGIVTGYQMDRTPRGVQKPNARFTDEDILSILQRYANGEESFILAQEYGADRSAISNIVRRKTWKHVQWPQGLTIAKWAHHSRGDQHGLTVLSTPQVLEIYQRACAGERYRRLAQEYPASATTISNIHHGKTWAHVTQVGA